MASFRRGSQPGNHWIKSNVTCRRQQMRLVHGRRAETALE